MIGECPLPLYDLALQCCNLDPDKRYNNILRIKYKTEPLLVLKSDTCIHV